MLTSKQEKRTQVAALASHKIASHDRTDFEHHHSLSRVDATTTTPMISVPPDLRATIATFNTAELLEHILRYLPASQLLNTKRTSHTFRNVIESSPSLHRKMSTFLRLGDVDENDLFRTDAGGEVVFPIKGLEPLAFFYPSDAERRLFVRFSTDLGWFERVGKAGGFRGLVLVDQVLSDVRVGWHCGCFTEVRSEVELSSSQGHMVTFGNLLGAMEAEHRIKGRGQCDSVAKFWLDGLWKSSKEMREMGC